MKHENARLAEKKRELKLLESQIKQQQQQFSSQHTALALDQSPYYFLTNSYLLTQRRSPKAINKSINNMMSHKRRETRTQKTTTSSHTSI
jgi:hypothetical protein